MPYNLPSWVDNATPINAANLGLINIAINAMAKSGHVLATSVGGTGSAITVTMSPVPAAYTDCPVIVFKAAAASTGPATISPNSLGAVGLVKQTNAVLAANDIKTGDTVIAVWDVANSVYVAANVGIAAGGGGGGDIVNARGYASNLKVLNNAVAPNSKLDASWDSVIMTNGSGVNVEATLISRTLDFGVVGVNGIDIGVLAASNWYYVWAISDGTNTNVLGSLSSTAPTMPGSYSYKRLIGAWRADGTANLLRAYQYNDWVYLQARQQILSGGVATVFTSVTAANFVPPNANVVQMDAYAGALTANGFFALQISMDGVNVFAELWSAGNLCVGERLVLIPMPTAQTVWYKATDAQHTLSLWVSGYRLPL